VAVTDSPETETKTAPAGRTWNLRADTMILALVAIAGLFTVLTDGVFLSPRNLANLMRQMSVTGILSVGMLLVIVSGRIDLSLGSLVGLTGGAAAIAFAWLNLGAFGAIAAALGLGLVLGLLQGYWVANRGVPAFIVTLGGMMVFRGILLGVSKGETIAVHDPVFDALGTGHLPPVAGILLGGLTVAWVAYATWSRRGRRAKLGLPVPTANADGLKVLGAAAATATFVGVMNAYQGVPVPVVLMLAIVVVVGFVTNQTVFGRQVYALGGNPEAARVSGVPIQRRVQALFTLSGLLAAVSGILLLSRLGAGTTTAGNMMELDAVAACVIGGTSLTGGVGTVGGAMIGALTMACLDNGMSLLNMESFWQYIVKGIILVLAVWADIAAKK
jgi:D-xylose transport system permease protein